MATDADTNTTGTGSADTGVNAGADSGTANTGANAGAGAGTTGTLLTDKTGEGAGADAGKGNGADDKDGKGGAGAGKGGAAAYELTAPEGYPLSEGALKGLNEMCKAEGIPQKHAEAFLKYMHGNYTTAMQNQQTAIQDQAKQWIDNFRADKEFGGDKFDASLADARKALATFDDGGTVSKMLLDTGYGNNPEVLRIFARVGRALGEDKPIGNGGGEAEKPLWDRLYKSEK